MINSQMTTSHKRLTVFILASVLAHAAVISDNDNNAVNLTNRLLQAPGISATLATQKSAGHRNSANESGNDTNPAAKEPASGNGFHSDNNVAAHASATVYARIRGQLQNHFYYPQLAKRQGWQGRVLLDFTISEMGRVNDIRIKKSSGYDILDHAAIGALRKVVIADMPVETLLAAVKPGRMSIPIAYRLIN